MGKLLSFPGPPPLTPKQKRLIEIEACRSAGTVDRVIAGIARPMTEVSIRAAARRLGLVVPYPSDDDGVDAPVTGVR